MTIHRIENLNGDDIYPLQNIKWITWITPWITQKVPNDVSSVHVERFISIIQASVSIRKNAH